MGTVQALPFGGHATMVPGTNMTFDEYSQKVRRHLDDPSQPDPRLLLVPNARAEVHNGVHGAPTSYAQEERTPPIEVARRGVRGPPMGAARGEWRPAAKDHSWQQDAVVGSVDGHEVTLRELKEAERRWKAEGGPKPEALRLSHSSFSASKTVSSWGGTAVSYTAHE